ncbi:ABC transporter permease [Clostridiales bacterium COT073_COT-073]|nr:ABC transporter permease [Clostridiales bacterium COT073_COT-073]
MKKHLARLYTFLIFFFLYAPILVLIIFSFNSSKSTAAWSGFSLRWYSELFRDKSIMKALYYTLLCAVLSSGIATVFGTITAYGIHHMRRRPQKILLTINNIPLLNPDIVTGISLMALFSALAVLRFKLGFTTMLIAHIAFNVPYVILSVLPKLSQMPDDTINAAMDLGATPFYAFRKVVLPEIKPGIITGAIMAFTMSIDDFVISYFTAGVGVTNLSIQIYTMARRGIKPSINALSTLMFVAVLILLLLVNKYSDEKEQLMS